MDVNIAVDYFGGEAVLKLGGHLNTNTAADLEEALEPVFERTNKVVLDFADLSTCRRRVFACWWPRKSGSQPRKELCVS